ncbi:unnamed protein product [Callosobruchus maculatus]|uniref:Uncharacterized protein n=1 Tax=Callosobruchus maculatus TaxID=64391 RepID=A0A653DEY1_CALMS|nr:unnamed protein product [Callosobruchus maculatus]
MTTQLMTGGTAGNWHYTKSVRGNSKGTIYHYKSLQRKISSHRKQVIVPLCKNCVL